MAGSPTPCPADGRGRCPARRDSVPKTDSPVGIFPPNPALAGKTCRWADTCYLLHNID